MSFLEFLKSKKRVDDLSVEMQNPDLLHTPGFIYLDSYYISEIEVEYPQTKGEGVLFHLAIHNANNVISSDLLDLEMRLYRYFANEL